MPSKFKAATYNVYFKTAPADVVEHARKLKKTGVSIILAQEVNTTILQHLAKDGWKFIKNPRASNAVVWDPEIWEMVEYRQAKLAQTYRDTSKRTIHTESPLVVLRHRRGGELLTTLSYHLPSRVQRVNPEASRIRVNKQAISYMDELARNLGAFLFGGDDNVDERRGHWPWMTKMKNLVQIVAPKATHRGGRKIDDFRIKGLTTGTGVIYKSPSDHMTHVREFTFKPQKKTISAPNIDKAIKYAQSRKWYQRAKLLIQAKNTTK